MGCREGKVKGGEGCRKGKGVGQGGEGLGRSGV